MNKAFVRTFTSSAVVRGKPGCSIVQPVHHRVKINKQVLSPRFPELKYPKNDIRSPRYKPVNVMPDRLKQHFDNHLHTDMLYMNYSHNLPDRIEGSKRREWDGTSAYQINRPLNKVAGYSRQQPDFKKVTHKNVPKLEAIFVNCYVNDAVEFPQKAIGAMVQVQHITGEKPTAIYSKTDVVEWKLRKSRHMGAKVELKGRPMHDFLLTLTELVLPKIPEFKGIRNQGGDTFGNLAFGLTAEQVTNFPEIAVNQDLWPETFGMHIVFKTTARYDSQAKLLLSSLGLPFYGTQKHN